MTSPARATTCARRLPAVVSGPAKGAVDTQPIADMAPVTISGHKAYGVYVIPGMGFRDNDATGEPAPHQLSWPASVAAGCSSGT